jgi:hypothetical protein
MTTTPEPTDKLDATTNVAVNGPADDTLNTYEPIVRRHATGTFTGSLEPDALKGARPVLRRARAQQCARAYPTEPAVGDRAELGVIG